MRQWLKIMSVSMVLLWGYSASSMAASLNIQFENKGTKLIIVSYELRASPFNKAISGTFKVDSRSAAGMSHSLNIGINSSLTGGSITFNLPGVEASYLCKYRFSVTREGIQGLEEENANLPSCRLFNYDRDKKEFRLSCKGLNAKSGLCESP